MVSGASYAVLVLKEQLCFISNPVMTMVCGGRCKCVDEDFRKLVDAKRMTK